MSARAGLLVVLIAWVGACSIEDQRQSGLPADGTIPDFSTYLQPVLGDGCGSLDCHGDAGRSLTLYAVNGLRMSATLRTQPATQAEIVDNMLAIAGLGLGVDQVEDDLMLLKPLAVDAGGVGHVGGDLWLDQGDPAYRCIHAWLRAGVADDAGRAVCTAAAP